MSKVCIITGRKVLFGNNVSHANNKSRRRFSINMQTVRVMSESLGESFNLRMVARGLRTIDVHGGLDHFLMTTRNSRLAKELLSIKKRVAKKLGTMV